MEQFKGKVWVLGDDIDTDIIIPTEYLALPTVEDMKQYGFSPLRPELAGQIGEGDIIVAGSNFGCGSSREQAPEIIKALKVKCVIAKSFARIFFRNSINNGLLLIENDKIQDVVKEGDEIEVTLGEKITHNGVDYEIHSLPVKGTANISLSLYPNQNNRTLGSKVIMIGGTGKDSYQYFKVSKRGIAIIGLQGVWVNPTNFGKTYGITNYVQKKSGSSWKTVSSSQYTTESRNYNSVYGLPAGSYRVVLKSTYQSGVIGAAYRQVAANSSYGTSKKKAKTISRKKYKKQTFLTTDSVKKEHWYKIKVSKKRTTYIDVTSLGSSGTIYCTVSGKARFKTKNIKNGTRYYLKAPKGTYYIRVKRYSKSTTGAYQVKYVK